MEELITPGEERCDFILTGKMFNVVWFLSWPVVIQMLLHSMVAAVDMKMVGYLGNNAVAAVGLSQQLMLFLFMSAWGLAAGITATVARYFGQKDNDGLISATAQTFIILFAFSMLFTITGLFSSRSLLSLLGAEHEVLEYGTVYIHILLGGLFFLTGKVFIWAVFQGVGDTKTPLKLDLFANVINIAANYVFIFGLGFIPAFGIRGAAMGSVLAHLITFFLAINIMVKKAYFIPPRLDELLRFHADRLRAILKVGIPVALQSIVMVGANSMILGVLARTADGTYAVSGYYLGLTIYDFAFLPGIALAAAAASLVGINLGNGNVGRANESGWRCAGLGAAAIIIPAAVIFIFAPNLMLFFINEERVIILGTEVVRVLAVVLPFHAAGFILARAMQGAGESRVPFYITTTAWLLIRVPLAWLLAIGLGWQSEGVWFAVAGTQVLAALLFGLVYHRGIIAKTATLSAVSPGAVQN
ncbi:MAG: MATE family efflux transporter [Bacillota bacterium]|nr:MATE family efflux transporter [Bacillota bacterium]MDW7684792.1 MATE family efflux transporter [Bacillota bacterium]